MIIPTATGAVEGQEEGLRGLRVLNVWHIGAWNRNYGDWALAYQMHRLFNEQARERGWHLNFYLVDGQRTHFHPQLIDQINEEADLVVLGGGGNIFHRPEDHSQSGWMLNMSLADLDRIRVPIAVYGVGYNRFPYDQTEFPAVTSRHLQRLQERSRLFSVRDQGTKDTLMTQFGLREQKLEVIPDPGICLYDRPIALPGRKSRAPVIAINWAGDRPHHRFPEPHEANMRHFFQTIKGALRRCVEELGAQIMFLPHLIRVDSDIYPEFADGFPAGSIFSTHEAVPFLYPPPGELLYPHVPFFTNLFRQADLVLGMRFHTCALAFGAHRKFIPLGAHQKVRVFAEEAWLPAAYHLRMLEPGSHAVEQTFRTLRACLDDVECGEQLKRSHAAQVKALRAFNERVLDLAPEKD